MGWQWHHLDHMQIICTSLQPVPHHSVFFYRLDTLPAAQPTAWKQGILCNLGKLTLRCGCSLCQAIHMQPSVSGARQLLIWAICDDKLFLVTWVVVDWNDPWYMKVIITYNFCCDNLCKTWLLLWKSMENSGNFCLFFVAILCSKIPDSSPACGYSRSRSVSQDQK